MSDLRTSRAERVRLLVEAACTKLREALDAARFLENKSEYEAIANACVCADCALLLVRQSAERVAVSSRHD